MSIEWFPGSIEEAIDNAGPNDRLLITFIDGSDKSSAKLLKYLKDPSTLAKINENGIKIFKISSTSENFKKFQTCYKTVPVPSIFFLDTTGKPLGLITSDIISPEALESKFNRILEKVPIIQHKKEVFSSDEEDEKEILPIVTGKSLHEKPPNLTDRDRIRQQIAVDRYELSQRKAAFLAGGQDLRVNTVSTVPTVRTGPTGSTQPSAQRAALKSQESRIDEATSEEPTKHQISSQVGPQLTNLIVTFNNGETRSQHFTYKTLFGVVRGYIYEVVKHDHGNYQFYISATSPHRVLVPELDKVSLEDLGLFPVAELVVHVNKRKINKNNTALNTHNRNMIQRLGGIYTILGVFLWIALSPIMVGTNWCGLCSSTLMEPQGENTGSWMYSALRTIPKIE